MASVCKPIPKAHCMLANSQWLRVVMFGNPLQDMTVYDCTCWTSCDQCQLRKRSFLLNWAWILLIDLYVDVNMAT
jgi:hypothetical protein